MAKASLDERKAFAEQLIRDHLQLAQSPYWPHLKRNEVAQGLLSRVRFPELVWQSKTNLCGMAVFVHSLAKEDPEQYVWLGICLYKYGKGRLGRGSDNFQIAPGKSTRQIPGPSDMHPADWMVLASLRDQLNSILRYHGGGVPVVKDIPLIGILFQPKIYESIAAINYPPGLRELLQSAGARDVQGDATIVTTSGYNSLMKASSLVERGYQVFLLIHTGLFTGEDRTHPFAEHWVRLVSPVDENLYAFKNQSGESSLGLRLTVFDPAQARERVVPAPTPSGARPLAPLNRIIRYYFGFVAGKF